MQRGTGALIDKNALNSLRTARGLTQDEVAQRVNKAARTASVTSQMVGRWERGDIMPSLRNQRALAEAFGVTLIDLRISDTRPRPDRRSTAKLWGVTDNLDPRVLHAQDEWRATRAALNANRPALALLAAQIYPTGRRLGDNTGLLVGPDWLPDVPVELGAVTLTHEPDAPEPLLDGTERESAHTRPLMDATHPYTRYTTTVRDLTPPKLFENRFSWRLLDVNWADGRGTMAMGDTTYFAAMDLYEPTAHELAYCAIDESGRIAATPPPLREMPLRKLIRDPFDLTRRPAMPSISTLVIRAGTDPTFLLHRRDSRSVAIAGGMLHVIPSGIFQPSSVRPTAMTGDFDLWRNMSREFAEELLGLEECNGDAAPVNYGDEPFATLDAARAAGNLRVYCLGVGLDALTLVAEILTVMVIEPDVFDEIAPDFVAVNEEGTVVAQRQAFDEAAVKGLLASGRMAPAGAGCLELAWRHRDVLLSVGA
jgi:transcriptional regulator with XRE-family HTH domain